MGAGWQGGRGTAVDQAAPVPASMPLAADVRSLWEAINGLRRHVDEVLAAADRPPTLDAARAALNEVGIVQARSALSKAVAQLEAAQAARREAATIKRQADDELARARAEADWLARARLIVDGAKTFTPGDELVERRAVTAAEREQWVKLQAERDPTVVAARAAVETAEAAKAEKTDLVDVAERRIGACLRDVDAAVASLATLRTALTTRSTL